ncbi:hypothetical protein H0H93_003645 [Arthromyces matolae]|nr:hypothetical protein H0H93_003645 [Arthromyces matolae]
MKRQWMWPTTNWSYYITTVISIDYPLAWLPKSCHPLDQQVMPAQTRASSSNGKPRTKSKDGRTLQFEGDLPQVPQTPPKKAKSKVGSKASKRQSTASGKKKAAVFDQEASSDTQEEGDVPHYMQTPAKVHMSPGEKGYCDRCKRVSCKQTRTTPYKPTTAAIAIVTVVCKGEIFQEGASIAPVLPRAVNVILPSRPSRKNLEREGTPDGRDPLALSQEQKNKVKLAALKAVSNLKFPKEAEKNGFCVITLMSGSSVAVQCCHIIAHSVTTNDNVISKLEFSWGKAYMTLNLNSSYNILTREYNYLSFVFSVSKHVLKLGFSVVSSLHWAFDQGHWALLPLDANFIHRMVGTFTIDEPLETIYEGHEDHVFSYMFLTFQSMDRSVTRCNERDLTSAPSCDNSSAIHYYPHHTVPILKLHVQPHHVIYDFGKKMAQHGCDASALRDRYGDDSRYDHITTIQCLKLFDQWMKVDLPPDFKGNVPDNSCTSDIATATAAGSEITRADKWPGLRLMPKKTSALGGQNSLGSGGGKKSGSTKKSDGRKSRKGRC